MRLKNRRCNRGENDNFMGENCVTSRKSLHSHLLIKRKEKYEKNILDFSRSGDDLQHCG